MLFSDMLAAIREKIGYCTRDLLGKIGGSHSVVGELTCKALAGNSMQIYRKRRSNVRLAFTLCHKRGKHTGKDVTTARLSKRGRARNVDINVVGIGYDRSRALEDQGKLVFNRKALCNLESVKLDRRYV